MKKVLLELDLGKYYNVADTKVFLVKTSKSLVELTNEVYNIREKLGWTDIEHQKIISELIKRNYIKLIDIEKYFIT